MELPRSKSSLRSAGAPGQADRKPDRKPGVHHPEDSQILQIMPPPASGHSVDIGSSSSEGVTRTGETAAAAGGEAANSSPKGRVGSLRDDAGIDRGYLSDDLTPLSYTQQNRLAFSVVFGDLHDNEDFSGEPDVPNRSVKQKKEQNRKATGPEPRIIIFAFRLALIEKTASALGTIAFVGATVVILGGFASTIGVSDFWVVTVIILAETSRIFSRSHELEWLHLSSKSAGIISWSRILSRWTRTPSGHSNNADSKIGHRGLQTSRLVRRAKSAPARFFGIGSSKSSESAESDLRTPTNSSSVSSRYNRRQGPATHDAILPTSAPGISLPSHPDLDDHKRTRSYHTVPLITFASKVLTTKLVSRMLYFAQIVSAMLCIGLSLWRLIDQKFYDSSTPLPNVDVSCNVFYVLAVLEAGLFLVEKAYWEYVMRLKKLLHKVCKEEDRVGPENAGLVKRFFYDVYGKSLKKSVFYGLRMDLLQFSISWIQTDDYEQQLGGARLLNRFVSKNDKFRKDEFASDALRRLGTTPGIIERLVEMLSWSSSQEEMLLREVATIVCRLVVYSQNCARFVVVPGAMDGVVSVLLPRGTTSSAPRATITNSSKSPYFLRLMGLRILKYLCKDHKNSLKIGETRGLLSVLMVFIEVRGLSSFKPHDDVDQATLTCLLKSYKKTLQVLLLLASATNTSGKALRNRIATIVSGLKNLRDMIEFGFDHPELQRLAIEVIYHLAMEDDVRKMIGATGGLIRNLLVLYGDFGLVEDEPVENNETPKEEKFRKERKLRAVRAGETLTRLVLQNEKNCKRLLELKDEKSKLKPMVPVLVNALSNREEMIASSAASILRSVLKYADDASKAEITTKTTPLVVRQIFSRKGSMTKSGMYEASLGLASRTVQPLDPSKYGDIIKTVNKVEFVKQLIKNLQHTPTTNKYPRIRRFSVELIIALIEQDDSFLDAFKRHNVDLKSVLEETLESISEVENFCLFSGLVGYTRHYEEMEDLVQRAIAAVDNYHSRSTSSEEIDL